MSSTVKKCTCEHEFQDKTYGDKMRVCTCADKSRDCKCTVCGKTYKL